MFSSIQVSQEVMADMIYYLLFSHVLFLLYQNILWKGDLRYQCTVYTVYHLSLFCICIWLCPSLCLGVFPLHLSHRLKQLKINNLKGNLTRLPAVLETFLEFSSRWLIPSAAQITRFLTHFPTWGCITICRNDISLLMLMVWENICLYMLFCMKITFKTF